MGNSNKAVGKITWVDLTVPDAEKVSDFYSKVIGWNREAVDMGGYNDFNMKTPATSETAAGICFARGINAALPAQWLIYITVENVDESAKLCRKNGGKIITEARNMGDYGRFCVIQDPAGAVAALYEPKE